MIHLADKIKTTLAAAHLNVRCLSAVTELHYTTIYLILRKGEAAKPYKMVSNALERALATIDDLIANKELPMAEGLSQDEKNSQLNLLFSKYSA